MLDALPPDGQDITDAAESFDTIFAAEADGLFDLTPAARNILLDLYEELQREESAA